MISQFLAFTASSTTAHRRPRIIYLFTPLYYIQF